MLEGTVRRQPLVMVLCAHPLMAHICTGLIFGFGNGSGSCPSAAPQPAKTLGVPEFIGEAFGGASP